MSSNCKVVHFALDLLCRHWSDNCFNQFHGRTIVFYFVLQFDRFLSLFAIIIVNIAILAHSSRVQFLMRTIPWFFDSSVPMIAVRAHSLGVMTSILMSTVVNFLSKILFIVHFLFIGISWGFFFLLDCSYNFLWVDIFYSLFVVLHLLLEDLDVDLKILIDQSLTLFHLRIGHKILINHNVRSFHLPIGSSVIGHLLRSPFWRPRSMVYRSKTAWGRRDG